MKYDVKMYPSGYMKFEGIRCKAGVLLYNLLSLKGTDYSNPVKHKIRESSIKEKLRELDILISAGEKDYAGTDLGKAIRSIYDSYDEDVLERGSLTSTGVDIFTAELLAK